MSKVRRTLLDAIGNTPLVELQRVAPPGAARIVAKLESANPTGSMKDRMARALVERAAADGRLVPGGTVVEYTAGTTGVSLALVCAALGYNAHFVFSDAFSDEKRRTMQSYGATLTENNLLGLDKDVELGWSKGVDRSQLQLAYNDPALFVPYLRTHVAYAHTSDGYNRQFNLRRAFYSFATPWAADAAFTALRQDDKFYRGGVEVSRVSENHRDYTAGYGFALDPNDARAKR